MDTKGSIIMGTYAAIRSHLLWLTEPDEDGNAEMSLPDAVEAIKSTMDAAIPDPEHPEQTLVELWDRMKKDYPQLKTMEPTYLHDPERMKERLRYSRECRDAMLECLEYNVRQCVEFEDTVRRLFGKNSGITSMRWIERLIKLESDEPDPVKRRLHNEEVVGLVALGKGLPQPDPRNYYKELRRSAYLKNLHLSPEEAEKKAQDDLDHGVKRLLDLVKEQVNPVLDKSDEMRGVVNSILTGTAKDQPDGLKGAYRKLMSGGNYLMFNALDLVSNLQQFGLQGDNAELTALHKKMEAASFMPEFSLAMQAANPICALLDPVQMADAGIYTFAIRPKSVPLLDESGKPYLVWKYEKIKDPDGNVMMDPKDPDKPLMRGIAAPATCPEGNCASRFLKNDKNEIVKDIYGRPVRLRPNSVLAMQYDFFDDSNGAIMPLIESAARQRLRDYGLKGAGTIPSPPQISGFSNNRGITVILYREPTTLDNGLQFRFNDKVPGRLVDIDLADEVRRLREMSLKHDRLGHSSGEYRRMKRKLAALRNFRLGDDPDNERIAEMRDRLEGILDAVDRYHYRKEHVKPTNHRNPYERGRFDFANALRNFADSELKKLRRIEEHKYTMALKESVEAIPPEERQHPELTAMEERVKFDDDREAARQAQLEAEAARAREIERIRQEQAVLASGKKTLAALSGIMKGVAQDAPKKTDEQVSRELEDFISTNQAAYDAAVSADDRFEYGQKVASGLALRHVLEKEEALLNSKPFSNALSSGKLDEVLDMVKDSDSYKENVGEFDLREAGGLKKVKDYFMPQKTALALNKGLLAAMRDAQKQHEQAAAGGAQNAAGINAPNVKSEPNKGGPVLGGPQ